jgi:hypothetical protein
MRVRFRGVPPPPEFDLWSLPDSVELRQEDVAAWQRFSLIYTERRRRERLDGLTWKLVNNRPRTTAGSLKKALAAATTPGSTAPDFNKAKPAQEAKAKPPQKPKRRAARRAYRTHA